MKELTKEKAVELHRAMWEYIVGRIDSLSLYNAELVPFTDIKSDALDNILHCGDLFKDASPEEYRFLDSGGLSTVLYDCFLCEYSKRRTSSCSRECPLYNPKGEDTGCLNNLYSYFLNAYKKQKFEDAKNLAIKIRDLPIVN